MNIRSFPVIMISMACWAMSAVGVQAQNSIQIFGPVDPRLSEAAASYSNPSTFNTNNLNLVCPANPVGVLSSTPSSTPLGSNGNVLVDNNLTVMVSNRASGGTVDNGPLDVCPASGVAGPSAALTNCFRSAGYQVPVVAGYLTGQDPDTFVLPSNEGGDGMTVDQAGGVTPINISKQLVSGPETVTISLIDDGVFLASSSLYLNTNWENQGGRLRLLRSGNNLEDFAAEVPPMGGALLAFLRSDKSWHGHHPYEGKRRAIQLNWVTDQSVADREQARHGLSSKIKRLFQPALSWRR